MADRILLRRGNKADLPVLNAGEPGFATDTKELYVGTATGNQKIVAAAPTVATWIAPTLLNSWLNYANGYTSAGYFKDDLGIVRLRGLIKSGTAAAQTTLFTLPAGYRPGAITPIASISSNGTAVPISIDIYTNGDVKIGGFAAGNTFLVLDGIAFRAES